MVLKSVFNKSKKGNVALDAMFYFLGVIVFIVIAVTGYYIFGEMNNEVQSDADMATEAKTQMSNINTGYPIWFDYGVATIVGLLWILVLVASFFVDTHPIFFIVSIFVLMIVIFAVYSVMGGIDDFFADADIATAYAAFPISSFIIDNIEKLVALIGFSIAIVLYGKYKV